MRAIRGLSTAALVVAVGLTGCAAAEGPVRTPLAESAPGGPVFSGPWAELFASTYRESTSEVERAALEDGIITDQEYSYFRNQVIECLAGLGIEAGFEPDRSLVYDPHDVAREHIVECMSSSGLRVLALRDAIDRNPDHRDENTIMVDCLQRVGVVERGYSADDLVAGRDIDRIVNDDRFDACNLDPLNHANE